MFAKWKYAVGGALLFLCGSDAFAICVFTIEAGQCVGCPRDRWALAASYNSAGGCLTCSVACRAYAPASGKELVESVPVPGAIGRNVNVTHSQLQSIAQRNPWAATALLAIQATGTLAELRAGQMVLDRLPTTENFKSLLSGLPNTTPLPEGVRARVTYRLERGPGEVATMTMATFTVDEDERMLYKVYPDVRVEFVETEVNAKDAGLGQPLAARQERAVEERALVATHWQVVQ
jgi:hypothetical protein